MKKVILIEHYGYAFTSNKDAQLLFTAGRYYLVLLL